MYPSPDENIQQSTGTFTQQDLNYATANTELLCQSNSSCASYALNKTNNEAKTRKFVPRIVLT